MGLEGYIQLPVIDFSAIDNRNPDTHDYDSVKTKILEAFQEYGCFQASIVGVSPELQNSVYDVMKHLFDLPLETKSKNTSTKMFHGYFGNSPLLPLYESMGIDDAYNPEQVENFTNLMWPQGNPQARQIIQTYAKKLWEFDAMVNKMLFESLNLDKYLNEQAEITNYVLKLMKYRVPEPNDSKLGLHSHADAGVMTILHQNEVEGLEIQTKYDEWLKVKLSPNMFIVMAGETLNVWLNGRLHVPLHRVMMRATKTRFSLAFFQLPLAGNILKPMEEMVDDDHPLLFKPFDYGEFIQFYITGGTGIQKYAVKAYCGV
ncbi:probable 2-oxoglutarate-dependent dioxygenase AOP1 [Tanacetum coccineum]